MVARNEHCDRAQLRALLDEPSEVEQSSAAQHIENCETCRHELQELAGQHSWWREASEFLPDHADDPPADMTTSIDAPFVRSLSPDDPVAWECSLDFLQPSDNPAMLGALGEYEILELIGQGGMGVVLKGYQRELNRYVAIKVLAPHYASSAAARKRFAREARAAAAVVHPHVVAIHAVNAGEQLPYLVMPFADCKSLQTLIDDEGSLEIHEVLRIGFQVASGLAAAHAKGLVHRDVKPANILLADDVGRVQLTDFGLARAVDDATMTRTGVIAGTPQFMSPEQARGADIDHRSDLFSLGSVLFAMCAGHSPFRAETTMGVLRRICDDTPRSIVELNPDVPHWLANLIARLHAKDPTARFQTTDEVAALLEQCLAHVKQPRLVSLPDELRAAHKPLSQRKLPRVPLRLASGIAGVVALVVLLVVAGHRRSQQADSQEDPVSVGAKPTTHDNRLEEWRSGIDQQIGELQHAADALQSEIEKTNPKSDGGASAASRRALPNRQAK